MFCNPKLEAAILILNKNLLKIYILYLTLPSSVDSNSQHTQHHFETLGVEVQASGRESLVAECFGGDVRRQVIRPGQHCWFVLEPDSCPLGDHNLPLSRKTSSGLGRERRMSLTCGKGNGQGGIAVDSCYGQVGIYRCRPPEDRMPQMETGAVRGGSSQIS